MALRIRAIAMSVVPAIDTGRRNPITVEGSQSDEMSPPTNAMAAPRSTSLPVRVSNSRSPGSGLRDALREVPSSIASIHRNGMAAMRVATQFVKQEVSHERT